jgi:thiol-disulfide isomerase/thioredoxin
MKYLFGFLLGVFAFSSLASAKDLSEYTSADELWRYIIRLQQEGPTERPKTMEQQKAILGKFFGEVDEALLEFTTRYAHDERVWDARLMRTQILNASSDLEGRKPDLKSLERTYSEIANAKDAPAETRAEASQSLIELHAEPLMNSSSTNALAAIEREIVAFQKQFPDDPRNGDVQLLRARLYQKADPAAAIAIARSLANGTNPRLAAEAQQFLFIQELNKKPLDLQFKGVDGTTVDLKSLHGKVVLLDFWATWCGPCVVETPNVVATYKKLHDKGFEIIGISLDNNKDKLITFTKQHEMTWPQYFDGKTWNNEVSTRFRVSAIPAMWLLDKKGYVRDTNARGDLAANVEKLLAE